DLWLSIKVLKSYGRCLPWASKAYHGLVHLRFTAESPSDITESQLISILEASPALRTLHLGHHLTDSLPGGARIDPVVLKDLELLIWESIHSPQNKFGTFLRWLAPG